jgi:membrane protein
VKTAKLLDILSSQSTKDLRISIKILIVKGDIAMYRGVTWRQMAHDLREDVSKHKVFNAAAALAYYLMLSIFPATIFMLSLLPFLPIPNLQNALMDLLAQVMPQDTAKLFTGIVNEIAAQRHGGLLSFGLILALWSGASGIYAIMDGINATWGVEEGRPFWKVRGTAILLMILFFVLVVVAFSLIVFGGVLQDWVARFLGRKEAVLLFFAAFRWVVILFSLILVFAIIYYYGPDVQQDFKIVTPGSILGVTLLILATLGFRIYVTNFANFSATYGGLGTAIILQLWLYIIGLVLLVGSEVNVLIEHYRHPEREQSKKSDENQLAA